MQIATLVLQYPDPAQRKTIALAATNNSEALVTFKRAVLTEAKFAAFRWQNDDLLWMQGCAEIERLTVILDALIPNDSDNGAEEVIGG